MQRGHLSSALQEWVRLLGEHNVYADAASLAAYMGNVSGLKRSIPAVLRPGTTQDVQDVVRIANAHKVPLHPISCGCNWGLGSRLPVFDDVVIVDLGRMNRIREVNVPGHYALVEPGVTQRQLYEHLQEQKLPLMFNVTGSALSTSLIGNALERGIGYFSSRAEALSGLEVVLGNGQLLRTGFGHFADAKTTYLYKYGVGPSLDGLFQQSNFGVVTAAAVDLIPQCEAHMAVVARIHEEDQLAAMVDAFADLRRRDILRTVVHIANRERTQIAMAPQIYRRLRAEYGSDDGSLRVLAGKILEQEGFGPWSAVGGMLGTRGQLAAARSEIRRALRGKARVMFMTDGLLKLGKSVCGKLSRFAWFRRKQALLAAVEPLYGMAKGVPSDAAMDSVYWPLGEVPAVPGLNPDQGRCGMLYCVPFLPADGEITRKAMEHTERVFRKYNFTPYVTLNMIDGKSLECVINLAFDRNEPSRIAAAHACNDELTEDFIRQGFIPYRVGPQSMSSIVTAGDSFWKTVRELKKVLDPNNIISPGRYNLP
ncbi:MAG TPA: FAD-binding oxidoreductase [Kiritimatiellia bacterium]|nr:FAD-binding oxidoreductase [Kiritimatiellia bacterium]